MEVRYHISERKKKKERKIIEWNGNTCRTYKDESKIKQMNCLNIELTSKIFQYYHYVNNKICVFMPGETLLINTSKSVA